MTTCEVIEITRKAFDSLNWRHHLDAGENVLVAWARGPDGDFALTVSVLENPECLLVFGRLPFTVPETKRSQVVDAVNRANFGLIIGFFEMNPETGRIYYEGTIPLKNAVLTVEQVANVLDTVAGAGAGYYRAFARLIYANDVSPAEVIAEAEMAGRGQKARLL